MFGGSPVELPFENTVDAILNMYLPGEEGGEATYELLYGKVNPSGKLCETWPLSYDTVPYADEFTKTTNDRYKESIFVGYRYYSTFGIPVKYPFGYGLSYTDFAYSKMNVVKEGDIYKVYVDVKNIGSVDGAAVVELFVQAPQTEVVKPVRELRGFEKIYLEAGEKKTVCVEVPVDNLKYYIGSEWVLENGKYEFQICSDVNTVLVSSEVEVDCGTEVKENPIYAELYDVNNYRFLNIPDFKYDNLVGREVPSPEVKRPYDLNTPIREYQTFWGKFLFKAITGVFELIYNWELGAKDSPDKETKVKNAYFGWRIMFTMSLRSMSYASEGMLTHKMALGLVDIANNHPLRGLGKFILAEECVELPE